jgi:uroporphyrinogen-III synthase
MSALTASLPLAGLRVLVTRPRAQSASFADALRALGATPVELPAIQIAPAPFGPLDDALERLVDYDWLIFTSVNGVHATFERLRALGGDPAAVAASIGAIGRATAEAVRAHGAAVAFVPERFVAEAAVEGLVARGMAGQRVLLPRADIARDTLPDGLRAAGAHVDVVVAYRTLPADEVDASVLAELRSDRFDVLTFASPSTVRSVAALLGETRPRHGVVACIGPITATAARAAGFRVDVEADEYSLAGLTRALAHWRTAGAGRVREGDEDES